MSNANEVKRWGVFLGETCLGFYMTRKGAQDHCKDRTGARVVRRYDRGPAWDSYESRLHAQAAEKAEKQRWGHLCG